MDTLYLDARQKTILLENDVSTIKISLQKNKDIILYTKSYERIDCVNKECSKH